MAKKIKTTITSGDLEKELLKKMKISTELETLEEREANCAVWRFASRYHENLVKRQVALGNQLGVTKEGGKQNVRRLLSTADSFYLTLCYNKLVDDVAENKKFVEKVLKRSEFYRVFLSKINGLGPVIACKILSDIDIRKANSPSSLWRLCGFDPSDGRGIKRINLDERKAGMEIKKAIFDHNTGKKVAYEIFTDTPVRQDRRTKGFVIPYNKDLRTVLVGLLAPSLIVSGKKWSPCDQACYDSLPEGLRRIKNDVLEGAVFANAYIERYYAEKHQKRSCQAWTTERTKARFDSEGNKVHDSKTVRWCDASPGHIDAHARRIMIKMFLIDVYKAWRALLGLTVRPSYQEEKLGVTHSRPEKTYPKATPATLEDLSEFDLEDIEDAGMDPETFLALSAPASDEA